MWLIIGCGFARFGLGALVVGYCFRITCRHGLLVSLTMLLGSLVGFWMVSVCLRLCMFVMFAVGYASVAAAFWFCALDLV